MIDVFTDGGYFMWPILVTGLLVLGLSLRTAWAVVGSEAEDPAETRSRIDAILFWGGLGAVLGVLGTVVGIAQMARAIERAGGVGELLLWGGFRVALTTTLFGLSVLVLALVLWFVLRTWQRRRSGRTAVHA